MEVNKTVIEAEEVTLLLDAEEKFLPEQLFQSPIHRLTCQTGELRISYISELRIIGVNLLLADCLRNP